MKKPNLDGIKKKMNNGKDFEITRDQYIKSTGADIPQNKYYTSRNSAVAHLAEQMNYRIEGIPEKLVFKKVNKNK